MVRIHQLTPEALATLPERSAMIPNHDGTLGLYTISIYNLEGTTISQVRVMNLATGGSSCIADGDVAKEPSWIPNTNEILYLQLEETGETSLMVTPGDNVNHSSVKLGEYDAPLSDLQLHQLPDGTVAIAVSGLTDAHDNLFNPKKEATTTSGRVFDYISFREYNAYNPDQRRSLWYTNLHKNTQDQWELGPTLFNATPGSHLDVAVYINETGGIKDIYDVSATGIAFFAFDRDQRSVKTQRNTYAYYTAIDSFTMPPCQAAKRVAMPDGLGIGVGANMQLSPSGTDIAFLYEEYQDICGKRLYLASTTDLQAFDVNRLVTKIDEGPDYNRPSSFRFTHQNDVLIVCTERCGRSTLAVLELKDGVNEDVFFTGGTVVNYSPLKSDNWSSILVSSSSFIDTSTYQIVDLDGSPPRLISSATGNGSKISLSTENVSEFWFEGADGVCMQSFMLRPSDFDENKKYPWVLLPHGGPVGSTPDAWRRYLNPAIWASQGYIVILPNVSSSVGFGTELIQRVQGQWGGNPYRDIVCLMAHLEQVPYLDQDKAVLCGGSYGGYMVSWILGHELAKKFCAAIWVCGVFNLPAFVLETDTAQDASLGPVHMTDLSTEELEKWNPASPQRLKRWKDAPPTIVVHGEKDYRVPITQGLAAFKVLQNYNVPSRFVAFEDESHKLSKSGNILYFNKAVTDWANRCIQGELKRGDSEW